MLNNRKYKALILGTGGASEAVIFVLRELGIAHTLVSRNPARDHVLSYKDLDKSTITEHRIIINTTPLGMHPDTEKSPEIDYAGLTPKHLVYDLIYNPETTLFLKRGKEAGATIMNGKKMLELQADKSWEIWNT